MRANAEEVQTEEARIEEVQAEEVPAEDAPIEEAPAIDIANVVTSVEEIPTNGASSEEIITWST